MILGRAPSPKQQLQCLSFYYNFVPLGLESFHLGELLLEMNTSDVELASKYLAISFRWGG